MVRTAEEMRADAQARSHNSFLRSVVAFSVLMQTDGGILTKDPDAVVRKFKLCFQAPGVRTMMGPESAALYDEWFARHQP